MKDRRLIKISMGGLMAAIIAVFTAFIKVNTGINNGYVHFGDTVVYLSGCLLGPVGMVASAIGGALADVLAGAAMWALPTAIIKSINALPFFLAMKSYKRKTGKDNIFNGYTALMTVLSGFITVGGYFVAEGLLYSFPTAAASVPFSLIQAVGSAVLFLVFAKALDKARIQRIFEV